MINLLVNCFDRQRLDSMMVYLDKNLFASRSKNRNIGIRDLSPTFGNQYLAGQLWEAGSGPMGRIRSVAMVVSTTSTVASSATTSYWFVSLRIIGMVHGLTIVSVFPVVTTSSISSAIRRSGSAATPVTSTAAALVRSRISRHFEENWFSDGWLRTVSNFRDQHNIDM